MVTSGLVPVITTEDPLYGCASGKHGSGRTLRKTLNRHLRTETSPELSIVSDKTKEYSGQFRLRLPKSLHAELAAEAVKQGVSLNGYVVYLLSTRVSQEKTSAAFQDKLADTVQEVHEMVSSMTVGDNEPGELIWSSSGTSNIVTQ